jgi:predicted DNA-binding protein (UPF0251 family)
MKIFSSDKDVKRVIFNVDAEIAARLERAKGNAKLLGKKLDVDSVINKALEKFLKKSDKKIAEMLAEAKLGTLTIGAEEHSAEDPEEGADGQDSETA